MAEFFTLGASFSVGRLLGGAAFMSFLSLLCCYCYMLSRQLGYCFIIAFFSSLSKTACAWIPSARLGTTTRKSLGVRAMSSSANNPFKRAKLDDKVSDKVIGTHSGTFQADEALGVWMLRQLPEYRNSKVVRSRDPKVLEKLPIVIDVGGIYDHDALRYDHHQRGYDERFDEGKEGTDGGRCTKLSASGLVYRHYGREVIKQYYPNLSNESLELAYVKLYDSMLEALDAIDTGVEMVEDGVDVLYKDSTGLSSRVSRTNPRWNEVDESTGQPPNPDERFEIASKMCGDDFLSVMTKIVESDIPARDFVERSLLKRHETDASGEIIALESGGLPWRGHLYDLEKEHNVDPLIKFVLYTDQAGMWRVQAVTVEGRGFENRLSLPEEWRGVRDQDLAKLAGIPGCTFCHAAGFIGGNETYEGALEMARVALSKK
jgi:uncharacterized UPF0160 family protein